MCSDFVVKPTQTVNVGQVTIPANSAAKILSANSNRKSARLIYVSGTAGALWLGTASTVTASNGFPYTPTAYSAGDMELDWQSDIYAFNSTGSSAVYAYVEEILS